MQRSEPVPPHPVAGADATPGSREPTAGPALTNNDPSMFPDAFIPLGQLPATARRLERAAGEVRERAGSPAAMPSLPATVDHLERALDELAASLRLMAEAAAAWSDADAPIVREATPDARALQRHLRAAADTLGEVRDRCPAIRR